MANCRNCGHIEKMCKCSGGRMSKAMPRPPHDPPPGWLDGVIGRNPRITNSLRPTKGKQSAYPPMGPEVKRYFPPGLRFMGPVGKSMSKADEERWSPGRSGKKKSNGFLTSLGYIDSLYPEDMDPIVGDKRSPRDKFVSAQKFEAQDWANNAGFMEYLNNIYGGGTAFEQDDKSLANLDHMRRSSSVGRGIREISYPEYENKKLPQGLVQGRTFYGLSGGRSPRGVGTAKRMQKGSISVPDKLKSMINGLLGVGRFDNVNPSAVAAALIANRQGGTLGMENFAPRKSPSSIGPRKSDVINTINALMSRGRVRDPENPNFIPFKQRETLRSERMPSSGSGLDKRMMKAKIRPERDPDGRRIYPPFEPKPPKNMMEGAPDYVRYTVNARNSDPGRLARDFYSSPKNTAQDFYDRLGSRKIRVPGRKLPDGVYQPRIQGGPTGGSMAMKSMMKSISSMNQGGVRHVVGGYRGGKMSKAMAASQTQTKNRYM